MNGDDAELLLIGENHVSYNLFAYCENDCVNFKDFTGKISEKIISSIIKYAFLNSTNVCGWSMYQLVKSAIMLAAKAFLTYKEYKLARALFNHGMWGNGRKPSLSVEKLIVKTLKKSSIMNKAISDIIKNQAGSEIAREGWVEFTANNKVDADLFYSLQHINFKIKGKKSNNKWSLKIIISDCYDFDNIRSFSGLSFGNAANDLGWAMQKIGMMVPFKISATYNVKVTE